MLGVRLDAGHVLALGHSGGGSTAPYVASTDERYTAFAVLHGGVFAGGLGPRRVKGWFSTGDQDTLRPPELVQQAAGSARESGFDDTEYHVLHEGHAVGGEELSAVLSWWLEPATL